MSDLADFLLARIAEDEEVVGFCLEAVDGDRTEYAQQVLRRTGPYSTVTSSSHCGVDTGPRGTVEASPGRILAECQAKRRIVEDATQGGDCQGHPGSYQPHGGYGPGYCRDFSDNQYLRLLALPYADHPDYREEWRP